MLACLTPDLLHTEKVVPTPPRVLRLSDVDVDHRVCQLRPARHLLAAVDEAHAVVTGQEYT
jgi:hypothetical protein